MRKRKRTSPGPVEQPKPRLTFTWWIVAATLLIVPLIFDVHGKDNFRLPKELAFRAAAVALLVVFTFWATRRGADLRTSLRRHVRDPLAVIALAIVVWTVFTTLTSTHRTLSADSLITVIASVVFFFGCRAALTAAPVLLIDIVLAAASANALLAIFQRTGMWQPFSPLPGEEDEIVDAVAFLGNSNDVGSYLVLPAIAALIGAVVLRPPRRLFYAVIALLLLAGLTASVARTAIAAYLIGVLAAAIGSGRRLRIIGVVSAALAALMIVWPATPLGARTWRTVHAVLDGRLNIALSGRVPSFLTAIDMARDRPIVGTGPGTFKRLYMSYRMDLTGRYPPKWIEGLPGNFAEVHNDHLQVTAETGLTGYLLLLTAIGMVVHRRNDNPSRTVDEVGRRMNGPFVVAIFILMLAHFPLQLAAPRAVILFFGAVCTSRTKDDP